jgi:hypothetical protein
VSIDHDDDPQIPLKAGGIDFSVIQHVLRIGGGEAFKSGEVIPAYFAIKALGGASPGPPGPGVEIAQVSIDSELADEVRPLTG